MRFTKKITIKCEKNGKPHFFILTNLKKYDIIIKNNKEIFILISILYFDADKYFMDEIQQIFNHLKKVLPEDMELIALPKDFKFYEDCSLNEIIHIRDMLNNIIEREEAKSDDL